MRAVRLRGSSFHNIYPSVLRRQAAMSLYKIHCGYSFVLICGRFRKNRGPPSLAAFTAEKYRKNALKYILLYFSKLKFQRMRHTFPVRLQRVFDSSFLAEIWQECCPIMWQKNRVGEFLFLASFESDDNVSKGNVSFIRT